MDSTTILISNMKADESSSYKCSRSSIRPKHETYQGISVVGK